MRDSMLNVDSTHKLRENIFEVARLKDLRQAIFFHATNFLKEIGYKNTDSLHFENVWANISHKGDYLFPHVHNGSLLSGVYYVKCDMKDKIKFFMCLGNHDYGKYLGLFNIDNSINRTN